METKDNQYRYTGIKSYYGNIELDHSNDFLKLSLDYHHEIEYNYSNPIGIFDHYSGSLFLSDYAWTRHTTAENQKQWLEEHGLDFDVRRVIKIDWDKVAENYYKL